jgi:nicotinate-nucleotide adenylyltransferase
LALEFIHRGPERTGAGNPASVALFPGTWNPPTIAHLDIARTALSVADHVVWVLPRAFPHKGLEGAGFEARCRMLQTLARDSDRYSVAVSDGGLYAEIAEEARDYFGTEQEIVLVLGRDAAERIASWDYGAPGVFDGFVRRHRLLVAARSGEYTPSATHGDRISTLPMASSWDEVSSSEVRRRIAAGEDWRELVPPAIVEMVRTLY